MLKFRSMRVNADDELQALLARQGTWPASVQGRERSARDIDRAFLRKHSLDEFPQLSTS